MIDVAVVGGGAIGCAIARELTKRSFQVALIERLPNFGMETSSRSSEVIHRGIYYPKDSLKSKFCISGREMLIDYMKEKSVKFDLCGKLIVSTTTADISRLKDLFNHTRSIGISDLTFLCDADVREIEPDVKCSAAIWSPNTGIFDTRAVIDSLVDDIEQSNTDSVAVTNCEVLKITPLNKGFELQTNHGTIIAKHGLVLSSGLFSHQSLLRLKNFPISKIPTLKFAKGYYFRLQLGQGEKRPFQRLVYPLPEVGGLGIHTTINLNGDVRFGPNVEWLENFTKNGFPDYSFPADTTLLEESFRSEISKYWPTITDSSRFSIVPDYAGIRPKISLSDNIYPDFTILTHADHGMKGLVCLLGMESPGWTGSLSIASYVGDLLRS